MRHAAEVSARKPMIARQNGFGRRWKSESIMLAVVVTKPGLVEIADLPEPVPGPYEAKVRTEVASLCNATDAKLVSGHFPDVDKYPLLLGHESVGIVQAIGKKVRSFNLGDRVVGGLLLNPPHPDYHSGWGAFSTYSIVVDHQALVEDGLATEEGGWSEVCEIQRVVPPDIPVEAAVLLSTWREVYGTFADFGLKVGDDILVFGAGPVGLSFVKFAKLLGLEFIGTVEPSAQKRAKAVDMGAQAVFAPDSPDLADWSRIRDRPFDAIVDAVGKEQILNEALPLIKMGGAICLYGVISSPSIRLEKERGPYNFNLLVHQWPTRRHEAAAQEPLCEWIRQGVLGARDFITAEYPVRNIAEAFRGAAKGTEVKTLIWF